MYIYISYQVFEAAGVDLKSEQPLITTCGSGVTAAVLSFALQLAGRDVAKTPVYDGAFCEYGDPKNNCTVATAATAA
jgi:thiosulfate/3-mercaptopyruvate sulfurtransferase